MVGIIATYVDVVDTLEENNFKLQMPEKGSKPGPWETRDATIAWRCSQAAVCSAICLILLVGDPDIRIGPAAALFWVSVIVGSIYFAQLFVEALVFCSKSSRALKAVLVWYDLILDTTVFEFFHFVVLISAGAIVEFAYDGGGTDLFVNRGLEELLLALIGSPGWLVAAVTLGLLLCIVIIWSTKDTIDKIKSMNVYGSKNLGELNKDTEVPGPKPDSFKSTAEPDQEHTSNTILGWTLGVVGGLLKLIHITVGYPGGWIFFTLGILNRIVQALLAAFTISTVGPLLAIDGLVTYYMLIWTSYFIVILSSLLAVVELVRWITIIVKVQGIFVPGSSAMWFYAIFTLTYDTIFTILTDVAAAFGIALAIVFCILGYECSQLTYVGGAFLWLVIAFYFSSLQSYNILQMAVIDLDSKAENAKNSRNSG